VTSGGMPTPNDDWVIAQSSGTKVAPGRLGSAEHPPLDDAPGCYVRDLVPADV